MIANSSWLRKKIEDEFPGERVQLCLNAIDHRMFFGEPRKSVGDTEVTVISYSGGGFVWKGFKEMAEAMRIARESIRGTSIRWIVYGPPSGASP